METEKKKFLPLAFSTCNSFRLSQVNDVYGLILFPVMHFPKDHFLMEMYLSIKLAFNIFHAIQRDIEVSVFLQITTLQIRFYHRQLVDNILKVVM